MSEWFREAIRPSKAFKPYRVKGVAGVEAVSPKEARRYRMVYPAGVLVSGGKLLILSGKTAGPLYHDHPHRPEQWGRCLMM